MKKLYKPVFVIIILITLRFSLQAQERIQPGWQLFYSNYEWVPGSVNVNMQLIDKAPMVDKPFLMIVGAQYTNCTADGFPLTEEYNNLYALSDSIMKIINEGPRGMLTGSFTCQCKRTDYIYVNDTFGIRLKIYQLFNRSFKQYTPLLWIKNDKQWDAYRSFLYPTEEKLELTLIEKITSEMTANGDINAKPRPVDHYIYFASKADRKLFIAWAEENQFAITEIKKVKGREQKFMVHITKEDFIEPAHFTHTVMELKNKLKETDGVYDHWACELVGE